MASDTPEWCHGDLVQFNNFSFFPSIPCLVSGRRSEPIIIILQKFGLVALRSSEVNRCHLAIFRVYVETQNPSVNMEAQILG